MAAADAAVANEGSGGIFAQIGGKLLLVAGVAAVVAVMVVFWLWSQQPDYRVLFSNYSDKDGGAIVAALEKLNVPYKFSDSGTAIMVPAAQVHQIRLKLAADGLPKGGNIGFELLENQKFGVSQFVEQVNFQRGLEGELERSIQSIAAVEVARIHLAIPKPSVFVRDQQKPTASVLLNLRPGRTLDAQQVSAVVHLVASSVPNLPTTNVTVVDQNGNLLSETAKKVGAKNLDPEQLKYVDEIQQSIVKRVESIITPIVGAKNVRAEASAEIDFSSQEQAAEVYKPNQQPDAAAVRSMQSNETNSATGATGGIPGALSNQPPPAATAPITTESAAANAQAAGNAAPTNTEKNLTTNYEVDKTVSYKQQPMGGIKRLNVAVVVNNMPVVDKATGKVTYRPLTTAEKTQINDLAMQAMGFNRERGDSLAIVNTSFAAEPQEVLPAIPLWENPQIIDHAKDVLRLLVGVIALFIIYRKALKPLLNKLSPPAPVAVGQDGAPDAVVNISANGSAATGGAPNAGGVDGSIPNASGVDGSGGAGKTSYEQKIEAAKQLAKDNPRMVANLVASWTNGNE